MTDVQHKRKSMTEIQKINWKRLFAEVIAIVGSILLAFAIDAWWQDRQERREEMITLQALHADFLTNEKLIAVHSEFLSESLVALSSLSKTTDAEIAAPTLIDSLDLIRRPATVSLRAGATNGLLGANGGKPLRSQELRAVLGQYQEYQVDIGEIEEVLGRLSFDLYIAYENLPENYEKFTALCRVKVGFWGAYREHLLLLSEQIQKANVLIEQELQ